MIAQVGQVSQMSTVGVSDQEDVERQVILDEVLSLGALMVSRTYLYTLFHKALGGEPCLPLFEMFANDQTIAVIDEYTATDQAMFDLKNFFETLGKTIDEATIDNAKSEFNRVFVGPSRLPALPWESPYVSHEPVLFHKNTLAVRDAYDAHGWRIRQFLHLPDDHISIMCDFMSHLANESLEVFEAGSFDDLRNQIIEQKTFIDGHMNNWFSQYAESLTRYGKAPLYSRLVTGLSAFAKIDSTFIGEVLVWSDDRSQGLPGEEDNSEAEPLNPRTVLLADPNYVKTKDSLTNLKEMRLDYLEDNELNTKD